MLLPQNYWLVFCFLHYIVFKVLCPLLLAFLLAFRALPLACFVRDSLFSIAIGVRFVNHFFDLFFKVLTFLDLVLPALFWCSIMILLSKSKCKCFLHILSSFIFALYIHRQMPTITGVEGADPSIYKNNGARRVDKRSIFAVFYIRNLNR